MRRRRRCAPPQPSTCWATSCGRPWRSVRATRSCAACTPTRFGPSTLRSLRRRTAEVGASGRLPACSSTLFVWRALCSTALHAVWAHDWVLGRGRLSHTHRALHGNGMPHALCTQPECITGFCIAGSFVYGRGHALWEATLVQLCMCRLLIKFVFKKQRLLRLALFETAMNTGSA